MKTSLGQRVRELRKHYGHSQKTFASEIGLSDHVPISDIERGVTKNPQEETEKTSSFGIYHDSSPTFDATFKNGKCTEHEMKISWEQTSIMEARIQKMGYSYNKKDDCWYNPSKSISWKTSQISDWFVLTCKKLK